MDTHHHHDTLLDVLAASSQWVRRFNEGRVDACVATYTEDAVMHARPLGLFTGRQAIHGFWAPFVQSGATDLQYTNVRLYIESPTRVRLSADWRMNVGRGIITNELWVRGEDGAWALAQDDFEVIEQFRP